LNSSFRNENEGQETMKFVVVASCNSSGLLRILNTFTLHYFFLRDLGSDLSAEAKEGMLEILN
jgi:hypothetical protein